MRVSVRKWWWKPCFVYKTRLHIYAEARQLICLYHKKINYKMSLLRMHCTFGNRPLFIHYDDCIHSTAFISFIWHTSISSIRVCVFPSNCNSVFHNFFLKNVLPLQIWWSHTSCRAEVCFPVIAFQYTVLLAKSFLVALSHSNHDLWSKMCALRLCAGVVKRYETCVCHCSQSLFDQNLWFAD